MGLIRAALQSTSSVFGDQFKEFVTCPAMERDVVVQKGNVQHGDANKNYTDGIITNGSKIVVPEGMAMMIVDNGSIKEFTAEAGEFIYDSSSEPSIFTGSLGKGIIDSIKTLGSRITYGGMAPRDQRVYYINLKVIPGNPFGTSQPARIDTEKYGMIDITFFGTYSIRVVDPVNLIKNVIGTNSNDSVTYGEITGSQMKQKFASRFAQAVAIVMRKHKVPFGDILMYTEDICNEMNDALDSDWRENYGIEVVEVTTGGPINTTDESLERIHKIDDATIFSNANLQSGLMATATADAMKTAAGNENGAAMGFFGMNMAQQSGVSAIGAVNQGLNQTPDKSDYVQPEPGTIFSKNESSQPQSTPITVIPNEEDIPKFCSNCGTPVTGKFCSNCGKQII